MDRTATVPLLAEAFRAHGYQGASLAVLSAATGLGKGSLYNFFPGGKEEMAAAVLAGIDSWFETNVFAPLRTAGSDGTAIDRMFDSVTDYFRSGERICLPGAFALGRERDVFADAVSGYFERWIAALADALEAQGIAAARARASATDVVAGIQGAIVVSRALSRPEAFVDSLARLRAAITA